MKIVYGQNLTERETCIISNVANECGILFDTARLLFYRGIDTVEKAKKFLSPGKSGFHAPLLLRDMVKAVERIKKAKDFNESVLIFGDYDADGICATTVLYNCLKDYGIKARKFIPEREEGYGLNLDTVSVLNEKQKIDLLITVDCGISDKIKIEQLKNLGIDVIVTDHHEPPEDLPDCIKINPKIEGQEYPFTELCGAGVAYKLGSALIGGKADEYLDFVALATVADSMDLVGENRDLVTEGLKLFNGKNTLRLPFRHLLGDTSKQVSAQTLAYTIAPRVNAGGRMGDSRSALDLFTEKDPNKVFDLAVKLSEYNVQRQAECDRIYREAKQKITDGKMEDDGVIMVADENWRAGFIGIVAAKLVEEFSRPVIVFAGHEDYFKGSARSVDGFNIHDAITSAKDLLIAFGGHSQAAGVSVSKENFEALKKALSNYADGLGLEFDGEQKVLAEWEVDQPFSMRFAHELDALEPFGVGNRRPLFVLNTSAVDSLPLKLGSPHYSFKTDMLEILDFNGEKNVLPLSLPINKKVVFELNLSTFKNKEYLKGYARYVCPEYGDFKALSPYIFRNQLFGLTLDGMEETPVECAGVTVKNARGALYVLSDPENLKDYPELKGLPVSLFTPMRGRGEIVVSPSFIPPTCRKVVYLDKPMQYHKSVAQIETFSARCGYKTIDKLSTDRSDFTRIYTVLVGLSGKKFKNTVDFCCKYIVDENLYQAIFVVEVFLELGIFSVKNGTFVFNQKVKNALTNSKVYSKIYTLKV